MTALLHCNVSYSDSWVDHVTTFHLLRMWCSWRDSVLVLSRPNTCTTSSPVVDCRWLRLGSGSNWNCNTPFQSTSSIYSIQQNLRSRSAWVGRLSSSVVCLSVCPERRPNSKTNDPKVFKLGIGNELWISWKWYGFGVERSKVKVTGSISAFSRYWLLRLS